MGLTRKQRVFVSEYLQCWNSAEAARRAGYKGRPNTIGPRLLADVGIAAEIKAEIEARSLKAAEGLEILAAQARAGLGLFFKMQMRWTESPLDHEEIIDEQDTVNAKGDPVKSYLVKRIAIDMDQVRDEQKSKLIKKFTSSPRNGVSIELYDAQAATSKLLEAAGVFKQINQNLNIDIAGLTTEQLERIARGENPIDVIAAGASSCGAGAAAPEAEEDVESDPTE